MCLLVQEMIVQRPKPVDGEALAILLGLQRALAHGWHKVIMESDCLQVINCLSRNYSSLTSYGAILDACLELKPLFESLQFCFIRRKGNSLAHRLATLFVIPSSEGISHLKNIFKDFYQIYPLNKNKCIFIGHLHINTRFM